MSLAGVFAAIVAITNLCGTVSVDTHGARVVSYVPTGGEDVLFVSGTGTGGMPLCWPWFAGLGPEASSRRHGVARYHDFKVVSVTNHTSRESEIVMRLDSDDSTRREFPHDFSLTLSFRLTDMLTVTMTGRNTGKEPFVVTEAFHPYLAVGDSPRCRIDGTDSPECSLDDPVTGNGLSLSCKGGGYRVWRPNPESHLSKTVSAINPGDWRRFVCIESGTFTKESAYRLMPGEEHTLVLSIKTDAVSSHRHGIF